MFALQALSESPEPAVMNLNGPLLFTLLLGVVLSAPISAALIWRYRRAVLKSMLARTTTATPEAPATPPNQGSRTLPELVTTDGVTSTMAPPAAQLYSAIRRGPWRVAAIYLVAGLGFATVMTALTLAADHLGFFLPQFLVLFWISAWPLVLTVNLIVNTSPGAKVATALVYFVGFACLIILATVSSTAPVWSAPAAWLLYNLPATVLLLFFLNRRVRAVGPLVLIFLILALAGPQIVVAIIGGQDWSIHLLLRVVEPFGLGGTSVLVAMLLFGFAIAGPIGWLTLKWIRRRYERKKISDETITVDAIWLLFGFIHSLMAASEGTIWLLSGFVAFLVYKFIAWFGFFLTSHRADPQRTNVRLLLLRVFSLGKRSEQLFGALAKHWRHVGSIQLIAGTDLATANLEPHEFLDFLSAKLARRFIDTPATLSLRIKEMDTAPDQDGRFRVNEFFSHDDTWKHVLDRLVSESDAVLMDLRGFGPQNAGCVYEIAELMNVVPLARVQFVIDQTTNEPYLLECMRGSWQSLKPSSPNQTNGSAGVRIFRFTGSGTGTLRELLRSLCAAARSGVIS
jgi:hypothetical protein